MDHNSFTTTENLAPRGSNLVGNVTERWRRQKFQTDICDIQEGLTLVQQLFDLGRHYDGIDIIEHLIDTNPSFGTELLSELHNVYQQFPQDRCTLYQARHFNFIIHPNERVLDVGSGNHPFPRATHLVDLTTSDHGYGRAGQPFQELSGVPVTECNVEKMPFSDKEFDFVYCSHVLEHVSSPERACEELMRVGKRGFIETPTRAKDIFLNTAKISNHLWHVEAVQSTLRFTRYREGEVEGLKSDILMSMNCSPQTPREKAFAALMLLKSEVLNTMFCWEDRFRYEVIT